MTTQKSAGRSEQKQQWSQSTEESPRVQFSPAHLHRFATPLIILFYTSGSNNDPPAEWIRALILGQLI